MLEQLAAEAEQYRGEAERYRARERQAEQERTAGRRILTALRQLNPANQRNQLGN